MTEGKAGARLRVLAALVVAMFAALSTRLWFLQVLAAEQYRAEARDNSVRLVETPAARGRILDVTGTPLVENRLSLVLTINRQEVGDREEEVLYRLSQLLDVPASDLGERLDSPLYYPYSPIPVAADVPEKVVDYVLEHRDVFPGVDVEKLPVRTYPYGSLAAHALGYLGQITQDKLDSPAFAGYKAGDLVGVAGVESVYEHELAGTPGLVKYLVNSAGRSRVLGEQDPIPGQDVYLTLDADTQQLAEESLGLGMRNARTILDSDTGRYFAANAGAVLVMNPDDGSIEAMASSPTFQPSAFTQSMTKEELRQRFGAAKGLPLLNRAIAGQYPPGSTYKPWIALAGLTQQREGGSGQTILTTQHGYPCPPTWTVPFDESTPNAVRYSFNNWTGANLGVMSLATALARSCDTVFYPAGYEFWKLFYPPPWADGVQGNDSLPAREPLQKDLRALGFGGLTNVDLPYEESGRVPDAEWKRAIHKEKPKAFPDGDWFPGDFINMSIGQGDTLVTPLQMATAYSALMNEGRECTPHVLDRIVDPTSGKERRYKPRCHQLRTFSQNDFTYVRDALTGTVRLGTAAGAFAGFPFGQVWVAAKTGTAQVFGRQDYSWFAAMTEANGERHVVVVLVEQAGHGSTTAAPIARRIIEGLYGIEFTNAGLGDVGLAGTD